MSLFTLTNPEAMISLEAMSAPVSLYNTTPPADALALSRSFPLSLPLSLSPSLSRLSDALPGTDPVDVGRKDEGETLEEEEERQG